MHKHILIATDGSKLADKGVDAGLELAKCLGARVTAVTVSEPHTHLAPDIGFVDLPADEDGAQDVLADVGDRAARMEVRCETVHVRNEFPAEAILREAERRQCDLIVMSSHGRRALGRALLGGEAVRVVTSSRVPVLVCK
ncbi:MAG: universal stress protein [Hyphomicrobiaceae bacterium]|nr:universal stress protein [Hyphomicrobiaceae bacterium]